MCWILFICYLIKTLQDREQYSYFAEVTNTQRGSITHPRSLSQQVVKLNFKLRISDGKPIILSTLKTIPK